MFAVIVVVGKDETALCNLLGNWQQMVQNITGDDSCFSTHTFQNVSFYNKNKTFFFSLYNSV